MKVVSVVGTKKCGKTTLVSALVASLHNHGRVGTIKNMQGHPVDHGDTKRHFDAGADVVIGLGEAMLRVTRGGSLQSALKELYDCGVDFAVVEGFKQSGLPKILLADIDLPNVIWKGYISEMDDGLINDLTGMIMELQDYIP